MRVSRLLHDVARSEGLSLVTWMEERSQQVPRTRILMTLGADGSVCVWKVNGQEPLTLTLGRLSARPLTAVESSAKSNRSGAGE